MTKPKWYKQVTTWTGIGAALSAIGGFVLGEITFTVAIPLLMSALIGIFCDESSFKGGK